MVSFCCCVIEWVHVYQQFAWSLSICFMLTYILVKFAFPKIGQMATPGHFTMLRFDLWKQETPTKVGRIHILFSHLRNVALEPLISLVTVPIETPKYKHSSSQCTCTITIEQHTTKPTCPERSLKLKLTPQQAGMHRKQRGSYIPTLSTNKNVTKCYWKVSNSLEKLGIESPELIL